MIAAGKLFLEENIQGRLGATRHRVEYATIMAEKMKHTRGQAVLGPA